MAEWSIAAVLKTVDGKLSGGSNPSLSAIENGNDLESLPFSISGKRLRDSRGGKQTCLRR